MVSAIFIWHRKSQILSFVFCLRLFLIADFIFWGNEDSLASCNHDRYLKFEKQWAIPTNTNRQVNDILIRSPQFDNLHFSLKFSKHFPPSLLTDWAHEILPFNNPARAPACTCVGRPSAVTCKVRFSAALAFLFFPLRLLVHFP